MSTLSVSRIQNTASPVANIVANVDGSVTFGLYRTTGVAPSPVQTGTLWYDIGGAGLVIWDGTTWAGVAPTNAPVIVATPTAWTDPGNPGEVAYDSGYFYWYDGANWQRSVADTTPW